MNKLTFKEKRNKLFIEMFNDMQFTEIVDAYYKDYTKCDLSKIKFPEFGITEKPKVVKKIIAKVFGLADWQIGGRDVRVIVMTSRNFDNNDKTILDFFKKMGYFAAVHSIDMYKVHDKLYTQWSIIQLEPIYQKNINKEVYKKKWLIHLTPEKNVEKILKEGILPFNKNELFNYIERCYFFEHDMVTDQDLEIFCRKLNNAYIDKDNHVTYCILKIDMDKISGINFYRDYNWVKGSIYTQQAIPPYAISIKRYINI